MKFNDNGSLEKHFLEFDKNIRELKNCGANLEEADIICHLLLTLPKSFDVIVTALDTMADDKMTLNFIKGKLLDHQLKRKAPEKTEKAVTTAFTGHAKNKIKCYACGKLGHKIINCRAYLNKKPEQAGDQKGNRVYDKNANLSVEENAVAFMTGDCSQRSSVNWFLDSGATDHMVNDIRLFRNLKKNQKPIKIAVAKQGETLEAECIGDIDIISEVNGKHLKIPIQNVLYVPNLLQNLFSIRKIEEKGMKIVFYDSQVHIYNKGDLVAKGNRNGKLYELVFKLDKSPEETANLVTDNEVFLWHKRLGHLGKDSIKNWLQITWLKEYPFQ